MKKFIPGKLYKIKPNTSINGEGIFIYTLNEFMTHIMIPRIETVVVMFITPEGNGNYSKVLYKNIKISVQTNELVELQSEQIYPR